MKVFLGIVKNELFDFRKYKFKQILGSLYKKRKLIFDVPLGIVKN